MPYLFSVRRGFSFLATPIPNSNHCGITSTVFKGECTVTTNALDSQGFVIDNVDIAKMVDSLLKDDKKRKTIDISCEEFCLAMGYFVEKYFLDRQRYLSLQKIEVKLGPADLDAYASIIWTQNITPNLYLDEVDRAEEAQIQITRQHNIIEGKLNKYKKK